MKSRDALYAELKDVTNEMAGISPKLSLHQRLKVRAEEIKALIGDMGTPIPEDYPLPKDFSKIHKASRRMMNSWNALP